MIEQKSAYLSVPIGDGIFYSVLYIVHILAYTFYRLRNCGPLAVAQPATPLIRYWLGRCRNL